MNAGDRTRFTAGLERLCVVFERRIDASSLAELVDAYWQALQRMDLGVFERVIERAVATLERFPKPAQLWGLAKDQRRAQPVVEDAKPHGDGLYGWSNRVMFAWLWARMRRHGVRARLTEGQLERVKRVKQDELATLRELLADKDPDATVNRFVSRFEAAANAIADEALAA